MREKFILYVGDDATTKNLHNLIRAFVSVFQEIPRDLVLVGPINRKKIQTDIESIKTPFLLKKEM